jgi:hypothetical protein
MAISKDSGIVISNLIHGQATVVITDVVPVIFTSDFPGSTRIVSPILVINPSSPAASLASIDGNFKQITRSRETSTQTQMVACVTTYDERQKPHKPQEHDDFLATTTKHLDTHMQNKKPI